MDIDYTFKGVFDAALDERIRTEQPKEKTIRDYFSSYRAFITDEFGSEDIRLITPSMVKEMMDAYKEKQTLEKEEKERGTSGYPKIIHFPSNKKSLIFAKNQAFS